MHTVRSTLAAGAFAVTLLLAPVAAGTANADTTTAAAAAATGGLTGRIVSRYIRNAGPSLYVVNASAGTAGWVVVTLDQYRDATVMATWWDGSSVVHNY